MNNDPLIVLSKLRPPVLQKVLSRPRLTNKMLSGDCGVVTITAAPGFGKTTLMAQFAKQLPGNTVWYQVDDLDNDPVVFLRHLISGVSEVCEGVGVRARERLASTHDAHTESSNVIAVLCDEFTKKQTGPINIFFDDCHLLDRKAIGDCLAYLSNNLPNDMRVIYASRGSLPFPVGRLRSHGIVKEINSDDLKLSSDELRQLLQENLNLNISPGIEEQLREYLDGWAAGLVLLESHLEDLGDFKKITSNNKVSKNVYEYMAEEILDNQEKELRALLIKSALMETVDPVICAEVTGIRETSKLLKSAAERNLFITRVGETGKYRLHPMFREFMLNLAFGEYGSRVVSKLHRAYGDIYSSKSQYRLAIEHYLSAESYSDMALLIEKIGSSMIENAEYVTLSRWLEHINGFAEEVPVLEMYRARMLIVKCEFQKALSILRNVKPKLKSVKEKYECSIAIAECLRELGHWQEGIDELETLRQKDLDENVKFEIAFRLGSIYFSIYDNHKLKDCCKEANKIANSLCDYEKINRSDLMEAMYLIRRGCFDKASFLLEKVQMTNEIKIGMKTVLLNNLASCKTLTADYEESKKLSEQCVALVNELKDETWLSNANDTLGCTFFGLGQFKKAEHAIKKSIDVAISGHEEKKCIALCHLGTLARWQEQPEVAYDYHCEALKTIGRNDFFYELAMCTANLGKDLLLLNQHDESMLYMNNAKKIAEKYQFGYTLTHIDFHLAWYSHVLGEKGLEKQYLQSALSRAHKNYQNHFIIQEGKITLPLLRTAIDNGIETNFVFWVLKRIGKKSLTLAEHFLKSESVLVQLKTIRLIELLGDSSAIALLKNVAKSDNHNVKIAAQRALKELRKNVKSVNEILTPREEQVLDLIVKGEANHAIAEKLFISEVTVKTHISNILRKLGMSTKLDAALYYQRLRQKN